MRILEANKYFTIHGGSEVVFFETIKGLRERGHTVAEFSMEAAGNEPSDFKQFFVSNVSLKGVMSLSEKWHVFKRFFSSREVRYKLRELVHRTQPEVVHLHNIYHELSADTFLTLRLLGIPMVMTVHDFFPLCANHNLLLGETLAEEKLANKPFNCFRYRAINNSATQSFAGMLEMYFYHDKRIWDFIDAFVCPSIFVKEKLLEYSFPKQKLFVLPNPLPNDMVPKRTFALGSKVVFMGRLHAEKGIKVFMQSLLRLPKYPVVVAGSGPEEAWIKNFIEQYKLTNVELRGWVEGKEKQSLMREARVMVVPSVFYETGGLSALEALANGRLVVASNRGALAETLLNGTAGILTKPEDPVDLARGISRAMEMPKKEADAMIKAGKQMIKAKHDSVHYLHGLEEIFLSVQHT